MLNNHNSFPVDVKFVGFVGLRLNLFKKKKDTLYQCRCPICGDSQSDKTKTRGYFYQYKGGMQYKCHNCGASLSLNNFLKQVAPDLHKEYVFERFGWDNDRRHKKGLFAETPEIEFKKQEVKFYDNSFLNSATPLTQLPSNHIALEYIKKRQIPDKFLKQLFYVEKFKEFANSVVPDSFENTHYDEPRIIIPFYNKDKYCFAFQGRALLPDAKPKYISIKRDPEELLVWGMDRIDTTKPVYVLEGPFDAMFVDNAVAAAGAALAKLIGNDMDKVFVFDAEPRNKEILKLMKKIILADEKVCIWPTSTKFKDINKMIENGLTIDRILETISNNTHTGPEAIVKLTFWAKVPF